MTDDPKVHPVVMISSTARDLPDHRKEVIEACLRQDMFPLTMEHLPAADADAIAESLRMVDEAKIYLGLFAHRYGHVPEGHDISITEMEYNRAAERGIPRLIFLMHDDHPIRASDVTKGEGAVKLEAFKRRLEKERVVNYFVSPADLRAKVIDALSRHRERDLAAFHYVSDIPRPPEPYIAHPYTLLQVRDLVGRNQELNLLADWVAKPDSEVYRARILSIVAIGGMGKSALTWKWFNDIAPQEMKPLAGRVWWSFYESDATFENFLVRALAYVTLRTRADIERNVAPGDREDLLLSALNQKPYLVVFDGLERILVAYARMDASRLADDDLDEKTANAALGARGLPDSTAHSFIGKHRLRKTANSRAGSFLRRLLQVEQSRFLISTRLFPTDLQTVTGAAMPGCLAYFIPGLNEDDALALWRGFGVTGSRDELLRLFKTFENHPLLIQALASEVAQYKRAPGDFDAWRRHNPDFDPFNLPLASVRTHVLSFALGGLSGAALELLRTIAAFRMPARYDTVAALLAGEGKTFPNEKELDATLSELEDRGLIGWDKRANRYDMHPVVRGVTWGGLSVTTRHDILRTLHSHFESVPSVEVDKVESLDELTPAIELYNTLIGLGRYTDALDLFTSRLVNDMLDTLCSDRRFVELLEALFTEGPNPAPRLEEADQQLSAIFHLAYAYRFTGKVRAAEKLYRQLKESIEGKMAGDAETDRQMRVALSAMDFFSAEIAGLFGRLREAEGRARISLVSLRADHDAFGEALCLGCLGQVLLNRGRVGEAEQALRRALRLCEAKDEVSSVGTTSAHLAEVMLRRGDTLLAQPFADRAWDVARKRRNERDRSLALRMQAAVAAAGGEYFPAEDFLLRALTSARTSGNSEEEGYVLVQQAELRQRQRNLKGAREALNEVWELDESELLPLIHADALNVLAQVERDEERGEKAVEAAAKAYQLAWCDGPPFAYHWGLEKARGLLRELGAGEPEMPAFDESKFEPMPEVEIDPPDEFGEKGGGE
jgi:tetratricopeptide (TPR) repeat protein